MSFMPANAVSAQTLQQKQINKLFEALFKRGLCSAHLARIFDALNVFACVVMRLCKLLLSQETHAGRSRQFNNAYVFQLMHSQILNFVRISFFPLVHPSALCSRTLLTQKLTFYSYSRYNTMPKKDKTVGLITYYNRFFMNMYVFCMHMNHTRFNNNSQNVITNGCQPKCESSIVFMQYSDVLSVS